MSQQRDQVVGGRGVDPLVPQAGEILQALQQLGAALVLLLPLPVPFTNSFPAWMILLIAGGLLERDGAAVATGYGVGAGGVAFFYFLGEAAVRLAEAARAWLMP